MFELSSHQLEAIGTNRSEQIHKLNSFDVNNLLDLDRQFALEVMEEQRLDHGSSSGGHEQGKQSQR